jgi:hypothetical protein
VFDPYLMGYQAAAIRWIPRHCNPWALWLYAERRAWDDGWMDAVKDRAPLPPREIEPQCLQYMMDGRSQ